MELSEEDLKKCELFYETQKDATDALSLDNIIEKRKKATSLLRACESYCYDHLYDKRYPQIDDDPKYKELKQLEEAAWQDLKDIGYWEWERKYREANKWK
jgi:hypothetical protein